MNLLTWLEENIGDILTEYEIIGRDGRKRLITMREPRQRLVCKDGFSVSIQEGPTVYSNRAGGVVTHVELGFPSGPMPGLFEYRDSSMDEVIDQECVFAYVPIAKVEEIIEEHGGIDNRPYWVIEDFTDYDVVRGDENQIAALFPIKSGPYRTNEQANQAIKDIYNRMGALESQANMALRETFDPNF